MKGTLSSKGKSLCLYYLFCWRSFTPSPLHNFRDGIRFLLKSPVLVSFLKEVYRCLEDTNTAVISLYADALKSLIDECIDLRAWFLALVELKPIGKNVFIDAFYYRERIEKMVEKLHQEIASIDQNKP